MSIHEDIHKDEYTDTHSQTNTHSTVCNHQKGQMSGLSPIATDPPPQQHDGLIKNPLSLTPKQKKTATVEQV